MRLIQLATFVVAPVTAAAWVGIVAITWVINRQLVEPADLGSVD